MNAADITQNRKNGPTNSILGISLIFVGTIILAVTLAVLPARAQEPPATPVQVAEAVEKEVAPTVELVGTARSNRISQVASETSGLVKDVHFEEGSLVEAGAVLVEMDTTNQSLQLQAETAKLAAIQAQLEEAKRSLERANKLKASRTISEKSHDQDFFRARNIEKSVLAAQASVLRLSDLINRMNIKAPFAGYIISQHTEVGQWLNTGAPVATLMDLSLVKVRVYMPERYISQIQSGGQAEVTFDALPEFTFPGKISAIIPAADEKSRNLPVDIVLENKDGHIKSGLLARVVLKGKTKRLLLIPKDALVLQQKKPIVFTVKDDTALPVPVTTGAAFGNLIEVSGPIKPGQQVVIQGNERLRPNQKVKIVVQKKEATPDQTAPPEKEKNDASPRPSSD